MNGRELLALLLMIFPSVFATALVTFTLIQYSEVAPRPKAAKPVAQAGAHPAGAARPVTQKRMRDPWENAAYTKTSNAPRASRCDPDTGREDLPCFYW